MPHPMPLPRRWALLHALIALLGIAGGLPAQSGPNTWTGAVDDNWFDGGNWSFGTIPTRTTDVLVAQGPAPRLAAFGAGGACRDLTCNQSLSGVAGLGLTVAGNAVFQPAAGIDIGVGLTVSGDCQFNGNTTFSGRILVVNGALTVSPGARLFTRTVTCRGPATLVGPIQTLSQQAGAAPTDTTTFHLLQGLGGGVPVSTFTDVTGLVEIEIEEHDATLSDVLTMRRYEQGDTSTVNLNGAVIQIDEINQRGTSAALTQGGNPTDLLSVGDVRVGNQFLWGGEAVITGQISNSFSSIFDPAGGVVVLDGADYTEWPGSPNPAQLPPRPFLGGAGQGVVQGGGLTAVDVYLLAPLVVITGASADFTWPRGSHHLTGQLSNPMREIEVQPGASLDLDGTSTFTVAQFPTPPAIAIEGLTVGGLADVGPNVSEVGGLVVQPGGVVNLRQSELVVSGNLDNRGTIQFPTANPSTIRLEGSGEVSGQLVADTIEFAGGVWTVSGDVSLVGNVVVEPSATLLVTGGTVTSGTVNVVASAVSVSGVWNMEPGSRLFFDDGGVPGSCSFTVSSIGRFHAVGAFDDWVTIAGTPGGDYSFAVLSGLLELAWFDFRNMGPAGVRLSQPLFPNGFPTHGVFAEGSPNLDPLTGRSTLLSLAVFSTPNWVFSDMVFDNSSGSALDNVTLTPTSNPGISGVTFQNAAGEFAGPGFESDPFAKIQWTPRPSTQGILQTTGAFGRVAMDLQTTAEIATAAIRVYRLEPSLAGDTLVGERPAAGAPGSYSFQDVPPQVGVPYTYRAMAVIEQGIEVLVASVPGTALGGSLPRAVQVGNGGVASIGAALLQVPPGGTLLVAPGTYQPFVVAKPVTILAGNSLTDGPGAAPGNGVFIDTSLAPVEIGTASGLVRLVGLELGTGGSTQHGLRITQANGPVLLDGIRVQGDPSQITGPRLDIDGAQTVMVQDCELLGDGAMEVAQAKVFVSRSELGDQTVDGGGELTLCDSTAGARTLLGTGKAFDLVGVMPWAEYPRLWGDSEVLDVTLHDAPGAFYQVSYATGVSTLNLKGLGIDMILGLDPLTLQVARIGTLGPDGTDSYTSVRPPLPGIHGLSLPFQWVSFRTDGSARFSQLETVMIVP